MHDVVVIGAGSAGAVIAARASEDPNRTVLLLEAGPDYPVLAETPEDLVNGDRNSVFDHDWGFSFTPVAGGRSTPFPRGRVVGGSSAVNTAIALRGMPEDYDHWAELGNDEWSWEKVLPAFCRLERDLDFGSEPYHGDAGPITIRRYPVSEMTAPQSAFLEAAEELGWPACPDANDPWGWGAGPHPMNKLGQLRVSTAVGYLAPARVRPNLTIQPSSPVHRLEIAGGRVTGAVVADGSVVRGRLFVLCGGAIGSPVLMLRSGLGPRWELESLGIDVVADVPGVGANLSDHPAALVVCEVKESCRELVSMELPIIQTILRYTAPGSRWRNDLQIEQLTWAGRPTDPPSFGLAAVLEQVDGVGSLRLTSAEPDAPVAIEPNFCAEPSDVDRLVDCFMDTLAFTETKALRSMIERVRFPRLPVDRDTVRDLVRKYSGSGYHPCGTVRMGPADDGSAVVDQFGRARCVDGLVVADASIMPTVPRANTNLTCIMIGEMVGEWLRT